MYNFKNIQREHLLSTLMILTAFALPLSITLRSVFLTMTTLCIIFQSDILTKFTALLKEPWCQSALLLFLVVLSGCLIGHATWHDKITFVNKYSKVLYLPLLALAFQNRALREAAIHAFLAAVFITVCLSFLKVTGLIHMNTDGDAGAIFHNHISTGYFMAFSAFLTALYSLRHTGWKRLAYGLSAILFSYHTLFLNTGRTGYILFGVLLFIFLTQAVSLRKIPLYLVILLPVIGLTAYQSHTLKHGVHDAVQDIRSFKSGEKNTSVGYRLQFSNYAKHLFLSSPVVGLGTAGFSWHFGQDKPVPAWGDKLLDPHNQYWLMAVEHGVVGLIVLISFFISLFFACQKQSEMRPVMLGLLITFLVANMADSFLLFAATGYFFILFAAICVGESLKLSTILIKKESPLMSELPC